MAFGDSDLLLEWKRKIVLMTLNEQSRDQLKSVDQLKKVSEGKIVVTQRIKF